MMNILSKNKKRIVVVALVVFSILAAPVMTFAATPCGDTNHGQYTPSIDIGCQSKGNPIIDMSFAIIRFLSLGVGLVVVASIVVAGIQYSTSQGDPQLSAKAKKRIQSSLTALLIFIFAYAILNYVVPSAVFNL